MKHHHECSDHGHQHCSCCGGSHSHEECCHEHHECHDQDFARKLIDMADQAWMEVLKEEIREEIRSTQGEHLKELAKQVSHSNAERWKYKMALEKANKDFKAKLCQFFNKE